MEKCIPIGGQGVIEGVMMKSPNHIAVSVRNDKGEIVSMNEKLKTPPKFWKTFFFRGIYNLIEMLIIGVKALTWSGNQFTDDDEEFSTWDIILLLLVSFGFALIIFVALPYILTLLAGVKEETQPIWFNLVDGLIKIVIFLVYILAISLMKDVNRIFQYHGAEHMVVHTYEHQQDLTIENARKHKTLHPRCGSSFLMLVFFISIIMFSIIPSLVMMIYPEFINLNFWIQKSILFPLRILVIPIIAGISYELLKFTAKFKRNPLVHVIAIPGLWLQMLTTKKPTDDMIEVAINSIKLALSLEKISE